VGEDAAAKKLQELVCRFLLLRCHLRVLDADSSQRSQKKAVDEAVLELPPEQFGRPKAPAGIWGSCIRIVDPVEVSRFPSLCYGAG
jgi:hypothetical protein